MARLKQGLEITRLGKKKHRNNEERRRTCKELLINDCLTPLEFLEKMSNSHCTSLENAHLSSNSEDSDTFEDVIHTNICVVCLQPRVNTWIFMPCRHANCCTHCSEIIERDNHVCPTCRSVIESRLQIFTD